MNDHPLATLFHVLSRCSHVLPRRRRAQELGSITFNTVEVTVSIIIFVNTLDKYALRKI